MILLILMQVFHMGMLSRILDENFPITMPYTRTILHTRFIRRVFWRILAIATQLAYFILLLLMRKK